MTAMHSRELGPDQAKEETPLLKASIGRVNVVVTGPAGFPAHEIFSILTPFLAPTGDACWQVNVTTSVVSRPRAGSSRISELALFPATRVLSSQHPDGSVCFEAGGMTALIVPAPRTATLGFPDPGNSDASRFGALAIIEILRHEHIHLVHAAAVEVDGSAVLITGSSGSGKSTLAVAWAASGTARFMADDRCFLWRDGKLVLCQGVAMPFGLYRVSEQILSRMGHHLTHHRAPGMDEKILYDAQAEFGAVERRPLPVKAVVALTSSLAPDHAVKNAAAGLIHQDLLRGGLYVGEPDVMKNHLDMISCLMEQADLFAAPGRAYYPQILDSLNRTLGRNRRRAPKRTVRPHPVLAAAGARRVARQLAALIAGDKISSPLLEFREMNWRPLLKLAEHHGLLATLGFELRHRNLITNLPEGLQHVVNSAMRTAEAGRLLHLTMLRRIAKQLDDAGIRWCVMKGPAIAERCFSPPAARPYSDLDIIVPFDMRQQVAHALGTLGFTASELNGRLKNAENRGEWVLIVHEPTRYTLELHWDFITGGSLRRFVTCDLAPVLERTEMVGVDGFRVPMTCLADQFVSCCVHATYGHGLASLRHLWDIAVTWQKCSGTEQQEALLTAARLGISGAVDFSMQRAETIFPDQTRQTKLATHSMKLRLALARLCLPGDATIRPWTRPNRLRAKLFRTALRQRWL